MQDRLNKIDNAVSNRESIRRIKNLYLSGQIDRETAQRLAEPTIKRINQQQLAIARKYGKKNYPKTTFIGLMR